MAPTQTSPVHSAAMRALPLIFPSSPQIHSLQSLKNSIERTIFSGARQVEPVIKAHQLHYLVNPSIPIKFKNSVDAKVNQISSEFEAREQQV